MSHLTRTSPPSVERAQEATNPAPFSSDPAYRNKTDKQMRTDRVKMGPETCQNKVELVSESKTNTKRGTFSNPCLKVPRKWFLYSSTKSTVFGSQVNYLGTLFFGLHDGKL